MALIAIVDDSRMARVFHAAALKELGHELLEVDPISLLEVLTLLKERKPDLMVVDYLMPGCPGASLVRACHDAAELADLKVILVTAHHEGEVEDRLLNLGVVKILYKPLDPKDLAESVTQALAG